MRAIVYLLALVVLSPLAFMVIILASAVRSRPAPIVPDYDPDDPGADVDDHRSYDEQVRS